MRDESLSPVVLQDTEPNSYDSVPYLSNAFTYAQCRRLESLASLHHLTPASPQTAKVLELGCGGGVNLIAQAIDYPSARFTGCDYSATAIASGQELIQRLGLENIQLRQADFNQIGGGWGKFDYIICHGVYSWVGPKARSQILTILRESLTASGIGCVSYNALPGWHLRLAVRDLVCHHAQNFKDPEVQVAQAREFLAIAAETQSGDTAYGKLIREEYHLLSTTPDGYLFHEMLEEHNQPFYFRQFVEQILTARLQYVGDANFSHLFAGDLPVRSLEFLNGLPLLSREQYVDFLRGTAFRVSVVCHSELRLEHRTCYNELNRFQVALRNDARLVLVDSNSEETALGQRDFQLVINRSVLPCSSPANRAVLQYLDERRPAFVPVQELCVLARDSGTVKTDGDSNDAADQCLRFLWDSMTAGAIEAVLSPPQVTCQISERPVVSQLARLQAQQGDRISNQLRETIRLSSVSRYVASLLDGTRDCRGLVQHLRLAINSGSVVPGPFDYAESDSELVLLILERLRFAGILIG